MVGMHKNPKFAYLFLRTQAYFAKTQNFVLSGILSFQEVKILPKLQTGLDVNVRFTGVSDNAVSLE